MHLVHYTEAEATPVILKRYQKGSNFTIPIVDGYVNNRYYSGDTMHLLGVDVFADSAGSVQYDMEVVVPSNNCRLKLFDMVKELNTWQSCSSWPFFEKKDKVPCTNQMQSFQYNVNSGSIDVIGNDIYLIK